VFLYCVLDVLGIGFLQRKKINRWEYFVRSRGCVFNISCNLLREHAGKLNIGLHYLRIDNVE